MAQATWHALMCEAVRRRRLEEPARAIECLVQGERIVHEAVEAGVTFFDNAWEYHEGRSEEWMGRALKGKRDKVFLMTKKYDGNIGREQHGYPPK